MSRRRQARKSMTNSGDDRAASLWQRCAILTIKEPDFRVDCDGGPVFFICRKLWEVLPDYMLVPVSGLY